ncbi:hypothetical protein M0208_17385 [Sphingomonas sp. SUN019]|uniref:hypothetical protein n=1 Tax=Sphingomonas sp. SUN019 TaxID=2937788 RepID=UPI00216416F0|nr:hypothetical protein [Sphingomonas sp. SUN019]UVO52197.1 hypothetical protein M0208_17385 [Sphingomonas sp. SUN019]
MDFSGILIIPMSAIITALFIIGTAIFSRREPGFRLPFVTSFLLGVAFLQPWHVTSMAQAGMVVLMLTMICLWAAAGCIIGAIPALIAVAIAKKIHGLIRLRA